MKAKNQIEQVLKHLKDFEKITSFEAFSDYGITRLSDKIFRLRKRGINIVSLPTVTTNRYGDRVNYSTYKIIK
ncbi:MAG: helix-turn-helix domain-containing protein [Candidatus Thorarchaeota archaeon]